MPLFSKFIIITNFFLLLFPLIHLVYALNADEVTLLSLLRHLTVPPSLESSWNSSDSTPCSWPGIVCDSQYHVVSLNLSSNSVSGRLGQEIGDLVYLQTIDLYNNSLSGMLPSQLGNCSQLVQLDLSMNNFTGEIPLSLVNLRRLRYLLIHDNLLSGMILESLFSMPGLEIIYLNNNDFIGVIPSNIGNMTQLTSLWLNHNKFSGTIPDSIGNCTNLVEFRVDYNQLVGNLPDSLNNLKFLNLLDVNTNGLVGRVSLGSPTCETLAYLTLSYNQFEGDIPDLGNCSSLTEFAAVNNSFTGTIPSSLGALTQLSILYLSGNSLSGKIPPEIGNCTSLIHLELYENLLEGVIPSELGMLQSLEKLWLYSNKLSGEFPAVIWTIPTLQSVIIYRNNLSGELPLGITALQELNTVILFENQFSGVIPQSLGINSSLDNLDFTNNKFTGSIPPNLCFGKRLRFLNLGLNQLQGRIPSDIGSCSTLQRLRLQLNNLTGFLPEFAENSSVSLMDMSGNSINGAIPSSLGNCANLSSINLSRNRLTGILPEHLGGLVKLQVLNFSHNNLQGPLPMQISNCTELYSLDMSFNSLNGSIPVILRSLTRLSLLRMGHNQFTGTIPDIFAELDRLWELQLGANLIGGNIPSSLGLLQNLVYALNLGGNNLTGSIPPEFRRLTLLQRLDLSQNNLTGSLAPLDELRSLIEVNVSYNLFEGPIPNKLLTFLNSSPSSFSGNQGLCFPCQSSGGLTCSEVNGLSPCQQLSRDTKKRLDKVTIVIIAVGSLILCVIVLIMLRCYFLRFKGFQRFRGSRDQELDTFSRVGSSIQLQKVLEATENLNERFIVGRGAHGTVYKVPCGPGKIFAVKKLEFQISKGSRASMVRELQTLGKIKHRNLVKVKDFWFRKEYGLILYKYMPNGSLHDVLHEISPLPIIEWDIRYRIALGVAQGLEYLHYDCDPLIVHRDIKTKNILLDSEMEPHISDFGIAKLIDPSSVSTNSVVGTIGYLAPETAFTTIWSRESDVYSYGVVLLELLSRKKPLDSTFSEDVNIVDWACSIWNNNKSMDELVDPRLMEVLVSNDMEQLVEVFNVALRCTSKQPNERSTMRDVVKHLTDIRTKAGSEETGV